MKTILAVVGGALALFLTIAMFGGAGWTHPPMAVTQTEVEVEPVDIDRSADHSAPLCPVAAHKVC